MSKKIKNQQGSALALALFLVVIISILGITLLSISSNSLKQVDYERKDQAVFYIAEAGMSLAKLEVKKELTEIQSRSYQQITEWITNENTRRKSAQPQLLRLTKAEAEAAYRMILNSEFTTFKNAPPVLESHAISSGKEATITVDTSLPADGTPLLYRINIVSKGNIDGAKEREVTQEIKIEPRLPFPEDDDSGDGDGEHNNVQTPLEGYSAISTGNINLTGSGKITGNVSTNGKLIYGWTSWVENGTIGVTSPDKIENIQASGGKNTVSQIVSPININLVDYVPKSFGDKFNIPGNIPYLLSYPALSPTGANTTLGQNGEINLGYNERNHTLLLTEQDTKLRKLSAIGGTSLTIDLGNTSGEKNLYIDTINLGEVQISIKGTGTLNIISNNISTLDGSSSIKIRDKQTSSLNLWYGGNKELSIGGTFILEGSVYNKSANIRLQGSPKLFGNIISTGKKITVHGGDASANGMYVILPNGEVAVSGSGKIKGIVMAETITVQGGGSEIIFGEPLVPIDKEITDYPTPNVNDNLFSTEETSMIEN
ncbi:pilus assembly PilX N-terminal domain-containing protein [Lysinibacillus sp. ZYM-1]|uniref:pilus assembly PilX N-terminal domain-containing protein n=1 Tax=Lysinibacillus sp. ZYM-1 TaxID=1681184 RepID=UPI0006CE8CBF|nr:pilus assembly PilX N-terminal domain-containing protein [Lysinibacillus sp. ZYM-1]KPN96412.1 hypothetical protein AO843_16765 [Lysinibacillus sp. ZYM-1]